MRFSIITPFYLYNQKRLEDLLRCIKSIEMQVYDHSEFEHILINDGSVLDVNIPNYPWIKVINQPNLGRVEAYNTGLKHSRGEIITFLDSDDVYVPTYLGVVDWLYLSNPGIKMFNFGNEYIHPDGVVTRRVQFRPKKKKIGHEPFPSGNIVNGTYVFHRSVYKKLGGFPPYIQKNMDCTELNYPLHKDQEKPYIRDLCSASPWDFSAMAQIEFPEIRKYFMEKHEDHPELLVKELGNPFGQDYYLFYKYTRKYHSKPIKKYLLQVYVR